MNENVRNLSTPGPREFVLAGLLSAQEKGFATTADLTTGLKGKLNRLGYEHEPLNLDAALSTLLACGVLTYAQEGDGTPRGPRSIIRGESTALDADWTGRLSELAAHATVAALAADSAKDDHSTLCAIVDGKRRAVANAEAALAHAIVDRVRPDKIEALRKTLDVARANASGATATLDKSLLELQVASEHAGIILDIAKDVSALMQSLDLRISH